MAPIQDELGRYVDDLFTTAEPRNATHDQLHALRIPPLRGLGEALPLDFPDEKSLDEHYDRTQSRCQPESGSNHHGRHNRIGAGTVLAHVERGWVVEPSHPDRS